MPYGGDFSAVDGLFFLAVTALAEAVKPKYGSNFPAVGVFRFLAVMTLSEAVKRKYAGKVSAIMPCGGNFSAVSGFSFFGGNVNGDSKLGGNCGA